MESKALEKFKDDILSRPQAAEFLHCSIRQLQRFILVRSISFIRTHFLEDMKGRIYFSRRKLSDSRFNIDPENKAAVEKWKDNIWSDKLAEISEQTTALELARLYGEMARLLEKTDVDVSQDDEVSDKISKMEKELRAREERRLEAFFSEGLEEKKEEGDAFYIEQLPNGKVLKLRKEDYVKIEDHNKNSAQKYRYEKRQR